MNLNVKNIDVFCEEGVYNTDQTKRMCVAGKVTFIPEQRKLRRVETRFTLFDVADVHHVTSKNRQFLILSSLRARASFIATQAIGSQRR